MSLTPVIETRSAMPYVGVAATVAAAEIGAILPKLWPQTFAWLAARGEAPAGAPIIRYLEIAMADEARLGVHVGIPTARLLEGDAEVVADELPAGDYAVLTHMGPYEGLMDANARLQAWVAQQDRLMAMQPGEVEQWTGRFESYPTDPDSTPDPAAWRTDIACLVASR